MANQDLFKPIISLWQHYVTIVAVGLVCWMNSVPGALIAIAVLVAGAAFEGVVDACRGRGRKMKKSHGPAFRAAQLDLANCPACRGRAVIKGVFHELACVQCNASGWVTAETGEALPLEVLVTQLSIRLQAAEQQIAQFNCFKPAGAEAQYNENNRRGPGATNFTGD